MEFGMFHEFPSLRGRPESKAFDEAMEKVDDAEGQGLDANALIGTPEGVPAETLQSKIGLSGILAELNCSGRIPQQNVLPTLRLLCATVNPRFSD